MTKFVTYFWNEPRNPNWFLGGFAASKISWWAQKMSTQINNHWVWKYRLEKCCLMNGTSTHETVFSGSQIHYRQTGFFRWLVLNIVTLIFGSQKISHGCRAGVTFQYFLDWWRLVGHCLYCITPWGLWIGMNFGILLLCSCGCSQISGENFYHTSLYVTKLLFQN